MFDWVLITAVVLSHSYVLNNNAFIFITVAFKKVLTKVRNELKRAKTIQNDLKQPKTT